MNFKSLIFSIFLLSIFIENTQAESIITSKEIINPVYKSVPKKGETRTDPTTGTRITRLTDVNDFSGTKDALIVYSRYSPENTQGDLFLVFGSNSTSSWVVNRNTLKIVANLSHNARYQIGENHEVRWDLSGKHPYRVYYRYDMAFYAIDDVRKPESTKRLIKDFSELFPTSTKIYNDVEGDSSNDSDHWAWMAVHYDGVTFIVDAFIHYQISTDKIDILKPHDLSSTPLNHYSSKKYFSRPNMVEVSPNANGIVLHYGRAWGDKEYGSRPDDKNTWFDGAHLWPLDFNYKKTKPVKISVGETHSGWAFDKNGNEYFISQNNRTDRLDAVKVVSNKSNYYSRIEFAKHGDLGWSNGFHFGKMPASKANWVFLNTYSKLDKNSKKHKWGDNQFIFIELESIYNKPDIIRISPNYNKYSGDYRDEAPAAINIKGNRIYASINWGGHLDHREVFLFEFNYK